MADWAALPYDLLLSVVQKIKLVQDFVVFGSVCKSWNEVSRNKKSKSCLRPQLPWLLPPGRDGCRRILSYSTKDKIYLGNLYIPEMSMSDEDAECISLNYGWVLVLSFAQSTLLHPLSRRQIQLPPFECHVSVIAAAMSANPSESFDFVVMIAQYSWISYWKPGRTGWTKISMCNNEDLTYYQDHFYSIDLYGKVWSFKFSACDDDDNINPTRRLVAKVWRRFRSYIVGSQGRLLVLGREENIGRFLKFHVYEVDLKNGSYKKITSLGDSAIFVGHNTSISVDHISEYQTLLRSDHVYFSRGYVGFYSLKDDHHLSLIGRDCASDSFWFIPSL